MVGIYGDAVETKHTEKKSYSITVDTLRKLRRDAKRAPTIGKRRFKWPVLDVTMHDEHNRPVRCIIITPEHYEYLKGFIHED